MKGVYKVEGVEEVARVEGVERVLVSRGHRESRE